MRRWLFRVSHTLHALGLGKASGKAQLAILCHQCETNSCLNPLLSQVVNEMLRLLGI